MGQFHTPEPTGDCANRAFDYLIRHRIKGLRLCHGYPTMTGGPHKGQQGFHCWLEVWHGGQAVLVVDVGTEGPVVPKLFDPAQYYEVGAVAEDGVQRYDLTMACLRVLQCNTYGPWE